MVRDRGLLVFRPPHAEAYSIKIRSPYFLYYRPYPIMALMSAAEFFPYDAKGQFNFIMDHHKVIRVDLEKIEGHTNGSSAFVHEILRHNQQGLVHLDRHLS